MKEFKHIYLNGKWVAPLGTDVIDVINPCTEESIARITMANEKDVDRAVGYARAAFPSWSKTPVEERKAILAKISKGLAARQNEIGDTIAREMGMPAPLSRMIQVGLPIAALDSFGPILDGYEFEYPMGRTRIVKEAIGVCGFITPWNYPLHQMIGKVAPALAARCTMIVKPSQLAPLNAYMLAEIMDGIGLPPGVFNLVVGAGSKVGNALAAHPDVDMVSLTGSTQSGVLVMQAAAKTIKRVTLELGGKSPNVILDGADLNTAVMKGVYNAFLNSGQTCIALSRMIVPADKQKEVVEIAKATVGTMKMGDAFADGIYLGPMVDPHQQKSVLGYIEKGIAEGATLVTGGPGKPDGLDKGYFVKPTVFADVRADMIIAKEEVFGPVLSIMPYKTEEEAIAIANDTVYGLSGSVWAGDIEHARKVAKEIRSGQVFVNGGDFDINAPAGGYKQSGIGRERSKYGLEEYLEVKAVIGPAV